MIVQPVHLKAPSKSRSWKTCAGLVCHCLHYIRWIKESQRKSHSSWRFPPGSEVFISCVLYPCTAAGCSTGVVPLLPAALCRPILLCQHWFRFFCLNSTSDQWDSICCSWVLLDWDAAEPQVFDAFEELHYMRVRIPDDHPYILLFISSSWGAF